MSAETVVSACAHVRHVESWMVQAYEPETGRVSFICTGDGRDEVSCKMCRQCARFQLWCYLHV